MHPTCRPEPSYSRPLGFVYLGWLADALTPRTGVLLLAAQGALALLFTRRYWQAVLRP